ncbi:MAG: NAD-dependent epimerase/dehydratase family protein [Deltaproteobacteria bacterium]|nr:NAD-dependent epimerase/dehydratase family protein [Deltaproteobacteria bacterium]
MRKILITGGAGFIGCNAAAVFSKDGWEVTVFDNLSRKGADLNKERLRMDTDGVGSVRTLHPQK